MINQYLCRGIFILLACMMGLGAFAQNESSSEEEKPFKLVPVPYLSYDRTLGFSIGALPMATFRLSKQDTLSPRSMAGVLGLYTTNKSWFTMAFTKLYFNKDNWRFLAGAGVGDFNYQFFLSAPINSFIEYNTAAKFFKVELQRKVVDKLYFGVNYIHTQYDNQFEDVKPDDGSTPLETQTNLNGVGAILTYDNRPSVYYPYSGFYTNLRYFSFPSAFDNEYVSNKLTFDFDHFFSVRGGQDVIASRVYLGLGLGDISFNQQFNVGGVDIRGYTDGKYRGDIMYSVQGEYRWNLHNKISLVGFLGVASVFESTNEDQNGKLLPGLGLGFRYKVFEEEHMNVGIDGAVGDGDWGIYFRIGEAF